jgi:glucans biosynthesis protein C
MNIAPTTTVPHERLPALDALRALAMLSVVSFHALQVALQHRTLEMDSQLGAQIYLWATHAWRMPVFFLISGFFTELLIDRRGVKRAWDNRRQRLLYPLAASLVVILPLSLICMEIYRLVFEGAAGFPLSGSVLLSIVADFVEDPTFRHLWFLFYLSAMALLWLASCKIREHLWSHVSTAAKLALLAIAEVALLAVMRSPFEMDSPTSAAALLRPVTWLLLFLFFAAGTVMYRIYVQKGKLPTQWKMAAVFVAVFAVAIALHPYFSLPLDDFPERAFFLRSVAAILMAGFMTAGVYFLLAAFIVFVRATSWVVQALIAASFFTYLVHYPLIYGLGAALSSFRWAFWQEATVLCVLAYVACFGMFAVLVRGTWVDRFLNGASARRPLS